MKKFICDGMNGNQYSALYQIESKNVILLIEETYNGIELSRDARSKRTGESVFGVGMYWNTKILA